MKSIDAMALLVFGLALPACDAGTRGPVTQTAGVVVRAHPRTIWGYRVNKR